MTGVTFQLAGDCGDAELRNLRPVDGFSIDGLSVDMLVTGGPDRIERLSLEVIPTLGEAVPIELDVQVLEHEPCTFTAVEGSWQDGVFTIEAAVGGPAVVVPVVTFGHCAENPWDPSSFPDGVAFEDESIVAYTSEGPARSVEFNFGVISQSGYRIDYPVRVNITE